MHYHLDYSSKREPISRDRLVGFVMLTVFLVLVVMVWLPFGKALLNATLITVLPADWAASYIDATLPKTVQQAKAAGGDRLIIETSDLRVDAPIVQGVTPADLLRGVGHDPASVKPGQQGRAILSGHRFWPSSSPWATVFFSLDRLKIGDKITVTYEGQTFHYTVFESWNIPKDQVSPKLQPTTASLLTLYTCGPNAYSAKNRMGFNAILDQPPARDSAPTIEQLLQKGIL